MHRIKPKAGMAILTVMLTFTVLFILLLAMVVVAMSNQNTTLKTSNYTKAYYVAESALTTRVAEIRDLFDTLVDDNPDPATLFAVLEAEVDLLPSTITYENTADNDSAALTMSASEGTADYPDYLFYTITATSTVNGESRTLSKSIGFSYSKGGPGYIIGKAVLTQRSMIIGDQKSQVIGPIASNLLDGSTIDIRSTQLNIPMAYVPTGRSGSVLNPTRIGNRITEVSAPFVFPTISYPVIPTTTPTTLTIPAFVNNQATINVFGYSYLENLTIADGKTLIVNLGSRGTPSTKKILRVKNVDVSGGIRVIGTGRLLLVFDYSQGIFNLGPKFNVCGNVVGSCKTTEPDYTKFLMYLRTPTITFGAIDTYPKLAFSNLQLFYGSLLTQYVNIEVKSDNFKGHIVTAGHTVNFSANSIIYKTLFYAPFATITIDSNAVLSGSLVANHFSIANPQTVVTYVEVDKESFPFSIDFPVTELAGYVPGSSEVIEGPLLENP
jgi:hypothetical protein